MRKLFNIHSMKGKRVRLNWLKVICTLLLSLIGSSSFAKEGWKLILVQEDNYRCGRYKAYVALKIEDIGTYDKSVGFRYSLINKNTGDSLRRNHPFNLDLSEVFSNGVISEIEGYNVPAAEGFEVVVSEYFYEDENGDLKTVSLKEPLVGSYRYTEPFVVPISAGLDTDTCGYFYTLKGDTTGTAGSTFTWDSDALDVIFTQGEGGEDLEQPEVTVTAAKAYHFRLIETNGACADTAEVNITFKGSPNSGNFGINSMGEVITSDTLCFNDNEAKPVTFFLNEVKGGGSSFNYMLEYIYDSGGSITFPQDGSYYPTTSSGAAGAPTINVAESGVLKVKELYDVDSGCYMAERDNDFVIEIKDKTPKVSFNSIEPSCYTRIEEIIPSIEVEGSKIEYLWIQKEGSGSFQFDNVNESNLAGDVTEFGDYVLNLEVTADETCSNNADLSLSFYDKPSVSLPVKDTVFCAGANIGLDIDVESKYRFTIEFKVNDDPEQHSLTRDGGVQQYHIDKVPQDRSAEITIESITDTCGCEVIYTGKKYTTTVLPIPQPQILTEDKGFCGKIIPTLEASRSFEEDTDDYYLTGKWIGDGEFSDVNSYSTTFESNLYGDGELEWIEKVVSKRNEAISCSDTTTFEVFFELDTITAYAGNDTTLFAETNLQLNSRMPSYYKSVSWDELSGGANVDADGYVSNLSGGENKLTWTIDFLVCEAVSDTITIKTLDLTFPTGFSPNGDGINDVFIIGGAHKVENNKLLIFDTNGKLVFSKENFNNEGWPGVSLDGEKLENNTFYYVFSGDGIDTVKDFLVIKGSN